MDEIYDVIILGTGLTECILSGLMSVEGKKVLHVDRNSYYGAETTSINPLTALFERFNTKTDLKKYGNLKHWCVDLIPKFLMANGELVKLLVHTGVTRYLEFKSVGGSFVYMKNKIHKVPSNTSEALSSSLLGFFEKSKFQRFLTWVGNFDIDNPTSREPYSSETSPLAHSIEKAFDYFKLNDNTKSFVGHAICLYTDDSYIKMAPACEVIQKMQLYCNSVIRFGKSPYLYPLYGLGELPQAFARLSAIHGGTYMLNKPVEEIVMEDGKVVGVKSEGEIAKCSKVICDPSYALHLTKKVGQVVRAICILNHPIANVGNATSSQIIILQNEIGRRNDIYVSCVSHEHHVCPENYFVALVATTVETPNPHAELKPGLDLLGHIDYTFYSVDDLLEPVDDGSRSNIFISKSCDASTHFETVCKDVLQLYERVTGKPFDFSKITSGLEVE